ncbi:MAG: Uma2 family endonuclease [Verrucomicrobia bacterium]|nr:Uma2 family endonuclease [Verrucomicrobiota bacterium]
MAFPRLETQAGPLEDGDCLSSKEFLRRLEALPGAPEIELVEGIVRLGPAANSQARAKPRSLVVSWLQAYTAVTPGTSVTANQIVLLDRENIGQPDATLRILSEYGGRTRVSERNYLLGAPELIVEILLTRGIQDLRNKLAALRRNGVQEYVVWRLQEAQVEWFQLEKGGYVANLPDPNSLLRSSTFPGLTLNVSALLSHELAALRKTLDSATHQPRHAAFVERLLRRKRGA